jgi:hypothetical protein
MTKEIITFGGNETKRSLYGLNSRPIYKCANSSLTRGLTYEPSSLKDCFDRFPSVRKIAENIGFIKGISGDPETTIGATYRYNLWTGSSSAGYTNLPAEKLQPIHLYLNEPSKECYYIQQKLGTAWLGCLWGTPVVPFSCTCPNIGDNFYAFLKLRLNVATFWNTPKDAPIQRAQFLDSIKYGRKLDITIAGDFNIKLGQVVEVVITANSGYPYQDTASAVNGYYYIIGIKHVVTNSGGYEMALSLTQIPESKILGASASNEIKFAANYP